MVTDVANEGINVCEIVLFFFFLKHTSTQNNVEIRTQTEREREKKVMGNIWERKKCKEGIFFLQKSK